MSKTRDNHYVPEWYQKGFFAEHKSQLRYLSLKPKTIDLHNGHSKKIFTKNWRPSSQCFYQTDLYTTIFGEHINDDIERLMFGQIDGTGSKAVRAFIGEDFTKQHDNFENFFKYIDAQKIRTPKGLDWLKYHYSELNQLELMIEMQAVQAMHCTLWTEGVREIVSAKDSDVKFIISDHPVTVFNYACPPDSAQCTYPNDPDIALKASQTIYPLESATSFSITQFIISWVWKSAAQEFELVFPGSVVGSLGITRGDGWQVALQQPEYGLRLALFLRAIVKSEFKTDSRVSIGTGPVDRLEPNNIIESTGSAFEHSGHGLEGLGKVRRLALCAQTEESRDRIIMSLLDCIVSKWTDMCCT